MKHTVKNGSWFFIVIGLSLLAAACAGSVPPQGAVTSQTIDEPTPLTSPASPTSRPPTATVAAENSPLSCSDPFGDTSINFRSDYWDNTDFCKHSVPLSEFESGGPPPDGIQPIDNPMFVDHAAGDEWLGDEWPVIAFEIDGEARAYPLAILLLHEIVNDEVAGQSVAVTYCPLCNAAIVFDRQVNGQVLDFGTTGNLRNSDLVMYDRQTESWWQQLTGEAVVGEMTGTQLEFLASRTIAWQDFKARYPEGTVLSRDSGIDRYRDLYGTNPYPGLDSLATNPFGGIGDERLSPMERVVAVELENQPVAYPFNTLEQQEVINDEINSTPLVVFWQAGVRSAVDSQRIEDSRDVGSTAVYKRTHDDQILTFTASGEPGQFIDQQTNSRWNFFGEAIEGPLSGAQLEQVTSAEHFWFAWAAFKGDTEIRDEASP